MEKCNGKAISVIRGFSKKKEKISTFFCNPRYYPRSNGEFGAMKKQINPTIRAHLIRGAFYLLLLFALCVIPLAFGRRATSTQSGTLLAFFRAEASTMVSQRTLTFAERVAYQRAIEEVYWRHRIWPKANTGPKPPLDKVMSQAQLEKKVEEYLRKSQALEDYWQLSLTAEQLQAEMDRMAEHSKQSELLREVFAALG